MIAPLSVRRAALVGVVALLALPTAAGATGGLQATPPSPAAAETVPPAPVATAGPTPTRASARLTGAGTWSAVPVDRAVRISGSFDAALASRRVRVERRTPSGRWQRAGEARVRSTGRFATAWRTRAARVHELRVRLLPTSDVTVTARSRAATDGSPSVRIAVLGRVTATWYGPGLYGRTTACGLTLQPDTVGVAHRTLPCGTQVEIRRGGRTVVAPVIDRGPFANGATFDLTKPVADAVGVTGVDPISFVQRDDLPRVATPADAAR